MGAAVLDAELLAPENRTSEVVERFGARLLGVGIALA